jgi:hypothetical protein
MSRRAIGIAAIALVAAVCGGGFVLRGRFAHHAPLVAPEIARELARGDAYANGLLKSIEGRAAESIRPADAVAVGYLERARLGLGSPFRLIDYIQRDPLILDSARDLLSYAILARTLRGEGYDVEAAAMDLASAGAPAVSGVVHRNVIDSVVTSAKNPRAGELSVRLAYRLAAAAGSVGRRAPWLAAQAAALVRDRELARADAQALLTAAQREKVDPLDLVSLWRAARRFSVERPLSDDLSSDAERTAILRTAPLVALLDTLAEAAGRDSASPLVHTSRDLPLLGGEAARRLAWVAAQRGAPPQAPVRVVVTSGVRMGDADSAGGDAVARFVGRASNEETLAAEYALLTARDTAGAHGAALSVLWAATSLRTYAQEAVWFPGDSGPSVPALRKRLELASISFDETVPTSWRPYYLRMLASAVADMQRVLPAVSLEGLSVHFGESPLRESALAMHDPATRTIFLPLETSAGVIAHEIGHDLDWQAARARYGTRGTYSTDRAVRDYNDRLAAAVTQLVDAGFADSFTGTAGGARSQPSKRPTEVFARNIDWFVSVALAREGRMNGYLSAVQDGVLTGYGAVVSPEVTRDAGEAMVRMLDEMTVVPNETRGWFLDAFGATRLVPAHELARRVLDAPLQSGTLRRPDALAVLGDAGFLRAGAFAARSIGDDGCRVPPASLDARLADARRQLVLLAADARARGMLRRRMHYAQSSADASWRTRALLGNGWDPSLAERDRTWLRDIVLQRATTAQSMRGVRAVVAVSPLGCN